MRSTARRTPSAARHAAAAACASYSRLRRPVRARSEQPASARRQPDGPGGDQRDPPARRPGDPVSRREFHVSVDARARYHLDETLFELSGNVILANLRAVRGLAAEMTARRRADGVADATVSPGELNALGLVDEILHAVVGIYREQEDPEAIDDALDHLDELVGADAVDATLARFTAGFPPLAVHRGELTAADYLAGETDGTPNREIALEELANCWLANANPAADPFRELFDDADLSAATRYRAVIAELGRFFATRKPFGPDSQDLVTMLRAPAVAEPTSLGGQLRWIRTHWGAFLAAALGDRFGALLDRVVTGIDIAAEDERALWPVSYTHLRAHETVLDLVCRLLLEK